MIPQLEKMDAGDVRKAYKRWAPVYDATFGRLVQAGVRQTVRRANDFSGRLLEVGVGTGLALPQYGDQLQVTGIDLSAEMLAKAHKRVAKAKRNNIEALIEMDATAQSFADASFDVAVAMYVLTVVPDPAKVMHELARITKSGGTVLVANHFSVENGLRGVIEKAAAKHATTLGWRPEFPIDAVLVSDQLRLTSIKQLKPMGFFTLLEFKRV